MTYVCPRCGARSEHPVDEAQGYCARCRDWTGAEASSPFLARVAAEAVARHEAEHHRDLPKPIPMFLAPIEAPLGPDDLCLVATTDELDALNEALASLDLNAMLRLVHREGSPWIEATAVVLDQRARAWTERLVVGERTGEVVKLALWRYTLAVYRIGADGAVEDDPIWSPE